MSRQRSIETIENAEYVTIGELVRLTGVRYSTLKFYSEEGILSFEQDDINLTRRYNREVTLKKISTIKELKEKGLTIPEIKEYF
ncbi:helix-turn-helix domain-containing protein [Anaerocolumna sp. AGMB13025]|uniref:helix-turn-helix domain-containing protein n=1 Tax=Anaerocolumna sp. AGMB13025 TaxID=3039116 RepID=UPI00241E8693|nr:helix-turn-helix domain-containing protein [Anaerocolumna sp. AGMB13025]WFR54807.1 helix-turn-helix domain-containing protein [Anaerocolumna sp. AGMB13025]